MSETKSVVEVFCSIDTDGIDLETWTAAGQGPASGFTATGDSFAAARRSFAEVVALAISTGVLGTNSGTPDSVRVIAATRKTFAVADLGEG